MTSHAVAPLLIRGVPEPRTSIGIDADGNTPRGARPSPACRERPSYLLSRP
ncbi:hypothetical protein GZL_07489 [Streptomyces sp. 769]|nr:hypothetical protein GZL_07489 [Streptomyces sp. 769]